MKKPLVSKYIDPKTGRSARFEYSDTDNFDNVDPEKVKQNLPGYSPEEPTKKEKTLNKH